MIDIIYVGRLNSQIFPPGPDQGESAAPEAFPLRPPSSSDAKYHALRDERRDRHLLTEEEVSDGNYPGFQQRFVELFLTFLTILSELVVQTCLTLQRVRNKRRAVPIAEQTICDLEKVRSVTYLTQNVRDTKAGRERIIVRFSFASHLWHVLGQISTEPSLFQIADNLFCYWHRPRL